MKANRAARRATCQGSPGDDGVSTVLGAILLFGLLVLTLTLVQTKFVPVWDKQRERDASLEVAQQIAKIKSDLDRVASNQTTVALANPVSLTRPQGFSFFQSSLLPGTATFSPTSTAAGMTVQTARQVSVQSAGGTDLYSLNEDWSWTGTAVASVLDVVHLRVRIPSPGGLPTGTQTYSLLVKDTNGNCAAEFRIVATGTTATTKTLEDQAYTAQSPPALACAASPVSTRNTYIGLATPAHYYTDPLADPGFSAALAALPSSLRPLTVSFTQGNTAAQTAFVYDQSTAFGTVRGGGSGLTFPSYSQFVPTGILGVALNNVRLPPQTYSFEYGGVFLSQPDGEALVSPPNFAASITTTQGSISWSLPALTGGSSSVAGARTATVVAAPAGPQTRLVASGSDISFTLTTTHGEAWRAFWDDRLQLAGLSSADTTPPSNCPIRTLSPQYRVDVTATSATLSFFGPCSVSTDTTKDVLVTFEQAPVGIDLRPGG